MTLDEIKEIAETWFEWPEEKREQVTYTSCLLFAREMYEQGQQAERERIKNIIKEYASGGWVRCCSQILESIEE